MLGNSNLLSGKCGHWQTATWYDKQALWADGICNHVWLLRSNHKIRCSHHHKVQKSSAKMVEAKSNDGGSGGGKDGESPAAGLH
jgi:hypothetical protein